MSGPIRLTLATELGSHLDGAWWPYTASMARELPRLVEVLTGRLGDVVDMSVSWSPLEGVPNLDPRPIGRNVPLPGERIRQQRVITITGLRATANLLVVPSRTTRSLAVMVLRKAAGLPIDHRHADSSLSRNADDILQKAKAECAQRALLRVNGPPGLA